MVVTENQIELRRNKFEISGARGMTAGKSITWSLGMLCTAAKEVQRMGNSQGIGISVDVSRYCNVQGQSANRSQVKVLGSTNPVVGWILHLPVCGGDTIFHTAEDQNNIKAFLNSFVEQHSSCHDGVGLMT